MQLDGQVNSKATIILTTFWEANTFTGEGFVLKHSEKDVYYKISPKNNIVFNSIALGMPGKDKTLNLGDLQRVDCFCPTYEMLSSYKKNSDWTQYRSNYLKILKERGILIKEWLDTLNPDKIYVLCCWENTCDGAKCHRQILYEALLKSKNAMAKIFPIYSHGNSKAKLYDQQ